MASTISRLTESIATNAVSNLKDALISGLLGDDGSQYNILHKYRVFNYNVTFALLSKEEFKSGSYKRTGLDHIIFKSSGKPPAAGPTNIPGGSKILSQIQNVINSVGGESSGDYDFFLQDLYIKSAFTASKDIATEIRMKVLEPYSSDGLMTSILNGMAKKQWKSQNRNNTFVLKIDFVGWRDDKEIPEVIPYTTRYYPMIITSLKASITQEGTTYEISGAPINDSGKYNDVNYLPNIVKVSGETLDVIMKDLVTKMNETATERAKAANKKPHVYEIEWAKGTESIQSSKMYDPYKDRKLKTEAFADKTMYTEGELKKRISNVADGNSSKLVFSVPLPNGISTCIDALILDSRYVVDKMEKNFEGELDSDGQLPWWRVVTKVDVIDFDKATNMETKKVTFIIIPRQVNPERLSNLFTPASASTAKNFDDRCARKYEWLFTGNNKDILNFRITHDNLFTRVLSAGWGKRVETESKEQTQGETGKELKYSDNGGVDVTNPAGAQEGGVSDSSASGSDKKGTTIKPTTPMYSAAREVHNLLNFPYEQTNLELEILGDPMWLGTQFIDSTIGVPTGNSKLFTSDGGIAFRTVDPFIKIISYSPRDFNQDGFLTASTNSTQDREVSKWSAYYQVTGIESYFQGGVFKQKLQGYRIKKVEVPADTSFNLFGFGVVR